MRIDKFAIIIISLILLFGMVMCIKVEYFNPEKQIERSIEDSEFKVGDWIATEKSNDPFVDSSLNYVYLIIDIKQGRDGRLYYKLENYGLKNKTYFGNSSDSEGWFRMGLYRKIEIDKRKEAEIKSWKSN